MQAQMRFASCNRSRPSAFAEATRAQEVGPWHRKMLSTLTYPPYFPITKHPSTFIYLFGAASEIQGYKLTFCPRSNRPDSRSHNRPAWVSPPVRVVSGIYDGPKELNQQSVRSHSWETAPVTLHLARCSHYGRSQQEPLRSNCCYRLFGHDPRWPGSDIQLHNGCLRMDRQLL